MQKPQKPQTSLTASFLTRCPVFVFSASPFLLSIAFRSTLCRLSCCVSIAALFGFSFAFVRRETSAVGVGWRPPPYHHHYQTPTARATQHAIFAAAAPSSHAACVVRKCKTPLYKKRRRASVVGCGCRWVLACEALCTRRSTLCIRLQSGHTRTRPNLVAPATSCVCTCMSACKRADTARQHSCKSATEAAFVVVGGGGAPARALAAPG